MSASRTNIPFQNPALMCSDQSRQVFQGISIESAAPPSYEEAINPNGDKNPDLSLTYYYTKIFSAPPPSYDSLFGRVREARKSSKGILEFLKNIIIIVLGTSKRFTSYNSCL